MERLDACPPVATSDLIEFIIPTCGHYFSMLINWDGRIICVCDLKIFRCKLSLLQASSNEVYSRAGVSSCFRLGPSQCFP